MTAAVALAIVEAPQAEPAAATLPDPRPDVISLSDSRATLRVMRNMLLDMVRAKDRDLTLRQISLLILASEGEYSTKDVAALLNIPKSPITRCCKKLVKLGLLLRETTERDQRLIVMRLTPAGEDFLTHLGVAGR